MRNQTKNQTYLEILVPYLNDPSEETIFGINKSKQQHETMKPNSTSVMLINT